MALESEDAVAPGNCDCQSSVTSGLISDAQLSPSSTSSSSSGNRDQPTGEHVASCLPNNSGQESSSCPEDDALEDCLPILVSSPLPQNKVV